MKIHVPGLKTFIFGRYGSLLLVLLVLLLFQPTVDSVAGKYLLEGLFIVSLFAGLRAIEIKKGLFGFEVSNHRPGTHGPAEQAQGGGCQGYLPLPAVKKVPTGAEAILNRRHQVTGMNNHYRGIESTENLYWKSKFDGIVKSHKRCLSSGNR